MALDTDQVEYLKVNLSNIFGSKADFYNDYPDPLYKNMRKGICILTVIGADPSLHPEIIDAAFKLANKTSLIPELKTSDIYFTRPKS